MQDCSSSGPNDEEDVWFEVIDEPESYEDCSGALLGFAGLALSPKMSILSTYPFCLSALDMMQQRFSRTQCCTELGEEEAASRPPLEAQQSSSATGGPSPGPQQEARASTEEAPCLYSSSSSRNDGVPDLQLLARITGSQLATSSGRDHSGNSGISDRFPGHR